MATSQNGWPAPPPNRRTFQVTDHTRITLRDGSAGFLLAHISRRLDREWEDIDFNYANGSLDDWGYAYRAVRGYSNLSNHASGTAIDLNATEHPLGTDTMSEREEQKIRHVLKMYNGCIRWGGDYSSRLDQMHFEIDKPLKNCETTAKRLMKKTKNGIWLLQRNPGLERVINS